MDLKLGYIRFFFSFTPTLTKNIKPKMTPFRKHYILSDSNSEYCYNNPVWIINMNNVAYDDLPDFAKGKFAKNGISFLQHNPNLKSTGAINAFDDPTKDYEIQVGQMKCKSQYDNVFQGGSEFVFKMVGVKANSYTPKYHDMLRID